MAVDFSEKEREFLDSLRADTGRDLDGWMTAIAGSGCTDRNAIIDWLRAQGFLFAKASWLERIHHNGGRPIYVDAAAPKLSPAPAALGAPPVETIARPAPLPAEPPAAPASATRAAAVPPGPAAVPPAVDRAATSLPASPTPATSAPRLEDLLAEAKAYRPLAQYVLREIERQAAWLQTRAAEGYVALVGEAEFGALSISPRELRLALAFQGPAPEPFVKARFPKTHPAMPSHLTHMVILTDARQITPELVAAVLQAAGAGPPRG